MKLTKLAKRSRIKMRVRKKIFGTVALPRLSVFRSNKAIYCQIIDDVAGHTLAAGSSQGLKGTAIEQAKATGQAVAVVAAAAGVTKVVFDRSGYLYHGRIKSLADGAREGGLQF
jgi:large subunit ribosomal protein L18